MNHQKTDCPFAATSPRRHQLSQSESSRSQTLQLAQTSLEQVEFCPAQSCKACCSNWSFSPQVVEHHTALKFQKSEVLLSKSPLSLSLMHLRQRYGLHSRAACSVNLATWAKIVPVFETLSLALRSQYQIAGQFSVL